MSRRLALWHSRNLDSLLFEARSLQALILNLSRPRPEMDRERMFKKMKDPGCGSILNPSDVTDKGTVRDILLQKHPDAVDINPDAIVTSPIAYPELGITCSNDGDPLLAILSMKIRNGGLGLDDPTTTTASEYSASLQVCATYADSQHCNNPDTVMTDACQLLKEQRQLTETERRSSALSRASQNLQSMVAYSTMRGASAWLSV
ncbi:hypothetical protein GJ496_003852 [Pomphorhynchus laevis]|nr:hypothetical protein GJ496_003852 [Pomphorhynchus laevis]